MGADQLVVQPGGGIAATLEVAREGYEGYRHLQFAPYADGWLAELDFMGPNAVLLRTDGSIAANLGQGPFWAWSDVDRSRVVFAFTPWRSSRQVAAVVGPSGLQRVGPAESVAGFLGEHEVVVTTRHGVRRVDLRDGSSTAVPGLDRAVMVSSRSGLLIGESADESGHPTWGVYDARSGAPVLSTPGLRLAGFDPSGRYVVGFSGVDLEFGTSANGLVVVEADTGTVVRAFDLRGRHWSIDRPVWEDGRTFLLHDFVRVRLDGTVERAEVPYPPGCCPNLLPPPVS